MKALSILSLFLLLGCASSTQNLIEQAHLTGDWTLVNQRMDAIERRKAERPALCPKGTIQVCQKRFDYERCACSRNSDVRQMLQSLGY